MSKCLKALRWWKFLWRKLRDFLSKYLHFIIFMPYFINFLMRFAHTHSRIAHPRETHECKITFTSTFGRIRKYFIQKVEYASRIFFLSWEYLWKFLKAFFMNWRKKEIEMTSWGVSSIQFLTGRKILKIIKVMLHLPKFPSNDNLWEHARKLFHPKSPKISSHRE